MAAHVVANATKMPKPAPHAFSHLDLPWTAERDGLVERVKGLEQVRPAVSVTAAARGCVDGNSTRAREGGGESRRAEGAGGAAELGRGGGRGELLRESNANHMPCPETRSARCITADAGVECDRTRQR
jgi:hypothetical protein